jgi:hypothetical protein
MQQDGRDSRGGFSAVDRDEVGLLEVEAGEIELHLQFPKDRFVGAELRLLSLSRKLIAQFD